MANQNGYPYQVIFRIGDSQLEKLEHLEKITGWSRSDILRYLIDLAASHDTRLFLVGQFLDGEEMRNFASELRNVSDSLLTMLGEGETEEDSQMLEHAP